MAEDQFLVFLVQLTLLLVVALGLGSLGTRFGLPSVVGELVAGVVLGPSVLGHLWPALWTWLWSATDGRTVLVDGVAQLGVLLFIAVAAAHLDVRLLRRRRETVLAIGGSALLVPLGLGIGAGYLLPAWLLGPRTDRLTFALLLGVVMAVSAIPVIAKTLGDLRMLHRDVGQLTLAAAAVGDLVAWLILSLVSAIALTGGYHSWDMVLSALRLGAFLVAVLLARPLVAQALRLADRADGPAPVVGTAVVLILAGSAASLAVGLEAALGAFVAGLLIGSSRGGVPRKLASLRTMAVGVFAPVFLAGAGLHMDLAAFADLGTVLVAAAVLALAVLGKLAGAYLGARLSGLTHWEGLALGAGLNARGALEVVVAGIGLRTGLLSETTYTIVVLVAIVTSVMAPPMLAWAMRRNEERADERLREADQAAWSPHR